MLNISDNSVQILTTPRNTELSRKASTAGTYCSLLSEYCRTSAGSAETYLHRVGLRVLIIAILKVFWFL